MTAKLLEEGFDPKQVTSDEIKQEFSDGKVVSEYPRLPTMGAVNKLIIIFLPEIDSLHNEMCWVR